MFCFFNYCNTQLLIYFNCLDKIIMYSELQNIQMHHKTFKDLLRVPDIFIYLLNIYTTHLTVWSNSRQLFRLSLNFILPIRFIVGQLLLSGGRFLKLFFKGESKKGLFSFIHNRIHILLLLLCIMQNQFEASLWSSSLLLTTKC